LDVDLSQFEGVAQLALLRRISKVGEQVLDNVGRKGQKREFG
jgi:hypothetical protein